MNKEITVLDLMRIIKNRLIVIISLCLAGLLVSLTFTFYVATPKYESSSQLLVAQSRTDLAASSLNVTTNLQLINTYKDIIRGPVILENVQNTLEMETTLETLAEQVRVNNQDDSQVFSITVTDENPHQAALIANTIAETFESSIWDIMNIDNVTIISRASPSLIPTSPRLIINLIIGITAGLVLGFGAAIILDWLDNTIKDEETIEKQLGWTTLGEVIEYSEKGITDKAESRVNEDRQRTASVKSRV